jgi:hypothetical protein
VSLLCRLGRHRPRGIPRWNDGLYFATCARCGRDLVRTAFEGWRVPNGYRIVWSDRPPASRPEVALIREEGAPSSAQRPSPELAQASDPAPAAAAAAEAAAAPVEPAPAPSPSTELPGPAPEAPVEPRARDDAPAERTSAEAGGSQIGRLPIQDVLAQLKAEDAAGRALESPPAPAEPPARQRRRSTWDFMDDEPFEEDRASGSERGRAYSSAPPTGMVPPVESSVEPVSRKAGGLPERWREVRSAVRNFFSGPAEPRPALVAGLALAVAVAVALALYSAGYPAPGSFQAPPQASAVAGAESEGSAAGEKPDPFAASAPHVSPGQAAPAERQEAAAASASDEVAYVSATLLVCREAPFPQAPRVRNLLRGKEVRVLGHDGAWASLAYRGGQCWAQAQYLSPVPTL